jgi:AraC-like DNA-binding protein
MDLIRMDGRVVVAGPDTHALITSWGAQPLVGLRFRPGALPRLLGVPAAAMVGQRVPLTEFHPLRSDVDLTDVARELASSPGRRETAPWSLDTLRHVTVALATGTPVARVARDTGWSDRTLQRQCHSVYGYGPAVLRRILRFRRAVAQLRTGRSPADVAADVGYADQPHLHREVRAFAGTTIATLVAGSGTGYGNAANRSTDVPSGSVTVAYR